MQNVLFKFYFPYSYRTLLWQFSRREVLGKYRGSLFGFSWVFFTPLLMLAVYSFVFIGVFKARWPVGESLNSFEFAFQIFTGLIVFNWFAEVASRAPRLILDQPNLVKKVIFPLEILSWVSVLSSFFQVLISLMILILAIFIFKGQLYWTALLSPLLFLCLLPLLLGIGWLCSALGVYLRDIGQVMNVFVSMALFLSPVFYSVYALSPNMQGIMFLNPLAIIIENLRNILLLGEYPNFVQLFLVFISSFLFSLCTIYLFQMTRKGFSDVL